MRSPDERRKKDAELHRKRRAAGLEAPPSEKTRAVRRAAAARWYAKPENRRRANRAKTLRKFGITEDTVAGLMAAQAGKCPGCDSPLLDDRFTHIDHSHETGKVRGLLCGRCNTALGLAKERIETLLNLGIYLEKHRGF